MVLDLEDVRGVGTTVLLGRPGVLIDLEVAGGWHDEISLPRKY
jgi:hypothetical protein